MISPALDGQVNRVDGDHGACHPDGENLAEERAEITVSAVLCLLF